MSQNHFINPAIQSVINANKQQTEMYQSIPKSYVENIKGIAEQARKILLSNQLTIDVNKKRFEMYQSIPKTHIKNRKIFAAQARKISTSNHTSIDRLLKNYRYSNIDELLKLQSGMLNSIRSVNSINLRRNLFSEVAINSFKKAYRFDNYIVSQAQQTIRDFYINPTAISTLTESINSSYPINQNYTYNRYNEFIYAFKQDYHILLKRLYAGQAEL